MNTYYENDDNLSEYRIDVFNNELIGCIAMYYVIKNLEELSLAKVMLILPMAFQDQLITYIGRKNVNINSIEQLLIRKPELLANFNERYYSLLKTSINCIGLLSALDKISIEKKGQINISNKESFFPLDDKKAVGDRAMRIINCAPKISILLNDNIENLYLQLRVTL